ncbi:MAG: hypothetical protein JKY54_10120, partial [Flavobacteriales bacterium]|nr:hypothetical protein [Flavobacteriales bacterium]
MAFDTQHKTLFIINVHHHYFLDEGIKVFGTSLDPDKEKKNLREYQLSTFLSITPSNKSKKLLKNWRGRFVALSDGFQVMMTVDRDDDSKPFIAFSDDLILDFLIEVKDSFFENYTDIEVDRSKLIVLSNRIPTASVKDTAKAIEFKKLSMFQSSGSRDDMNID